jgi:hypothetical protein
MSCMASIAQYEFGPEWIQSRFRLVHHDHDKYRIQSLDTTYHAIEDVKVVVYFHDTANTPSDLIRCMKDDDMAEYKT